MKLTKKKLKKMIKEELDNLNEREVQRTKKLCDMDVDHGSITVTQHYNIDPLNAIDNIEYVNVYLYDHDTYEDVDLEFSMEEFELFINKLKRINLSTLE